MSTKLACKKTTLTCAIAFALGLPMAAQAQLEEVIVTAQKRSESVQDVPIAINALTGNMMGKLGVSDTDDIEGLYPNLSTHNASSANTGFTIRGVGTDNFHISGQQSVTTYIDDVGLTSPFISTIGVFDTERVEVLRGPQNTLYGRNTIGGAVNFHSVKPEVGGELNGKASLTVGQDGEQDIEFAVGGPIGDSWAYRLAGKKSDLDGHLTNIVNGKQEGGYDRSGIRLMLAGDISENTNLRVSLYSGDTEGDSALVVNTGNFDANGNSCSNDVDVDRALTLQGCNYTQVLKTGELAPNTVLGQFIADNPDRYVSNANGNFINLWTPEGQVVAHPGGGYTGDHDGINIYVQHDFETMSFNSITSYSETYFQGNFYRNLHGFSSHQEGDWESLTQEFRLTSNFDGPFQFLAGLYYNQEDSIQDTWVVNMLPTGPATGVNPGVFIDSEYQNTGLYVQLDYEINDRLNLTGGLRYTKDKLEGDWAKRVLAGPDGVTTTDIGYQSGRDYITANDTGNVIATVPHPVQKLSESGVKLGFDYQLDTGMVYGSYSTGFKGGAYDNRALSNGSNPIGPEYVDAFELGFKATLLEDTVEFNVAVFLYEWQDQQLFETDQNGLPTTLNIEETELKGLEIDVKWAPSANFYIQTGFGITDTEIIAPGAEAESTGSAVSPGDEIPNVPSKSFNALAVYTIPVSNGSVDIQGSYRYAGSYVQDFQPELARSQVKAHDWLNARITYNFGEAEQYSIAAYGNNLTGEYYCSDITTGLPSRNQFACQIDGGAYGEPTYGVSFSAEF
jgi:iron complex outermembrane receptor protein